MKNPVIDSYLMIYEAVEKELYSALIIYSEIEDCSRFSNEEKVFSYAGLVPRVHQSGNTSYSAKHF